LPGEPDAVTDLPGSDPAIVGADSGE
jgi:hypothetical protein